MPHQQPDQVERPSDQFFLIGRPPALSSSPRFFCSFVPPHGVLLLLVLIGNEDLFTCFQKIHSFLCCFLVVDIRIEASKHPSQCRAFHVELVLGGAGSKRPSNPAAYQWPCTCSLSLSCFTTHPSLPPSLLDHLPP
jgi:hypothetical protein